MLKVSKQYNSCLCVLCPQVTPLPLYISMLRGLERLVLADVLSQQDADTLVKLSVDRLCLPSPQRALGALGLMLTCMYAGKRERKINHLKAV